MTLEQPKPTRDQLIQSDLAMQLAQAHLVIAQLRADITELRDQLKDAGDRASSPLPRTAPLVDAGQPAVRTADTG